MLEYVGTALLVIWTLTGECLEIEMLAKDCHDAAIYIHTTGTLNKGELSAVEVLEQMPVRSAECRPIHHIQIGGAPS